MRHKNRKETIKKILKKKKEIPVIEMSIANYNNANFYITLLYNSTIDKYKVLYIPLDAAELDRIEEYFCYQFINVKSVIYMKNQMTSMLEKYQQPEKRDKSNKNINNFEIEINYYEDKKMYDFHMTRHLPKEWKFMFEVIALLFEHTPNIMGELATEILSVVMNTNDSIEYQASLNCDLAASDLVEFFPVIKTEKLAEGNLSFLEKVNGKYYAIIEKHLLIIEYNSTAKILNVFCDDKNLVYSTYTYQVLKAIKDEKEYPFPKIKVIKKGEKYNYLCLGVEKEKLKIIKDNKLSAIALPKKKRNEIIILEDKESKLEKELDRVME